MRDPEDVWFQEEVQMGRAVPGNAAVVIGKILLWYNLIPFAFIYMSVKDGSNFWLWWVVVEGVVGLASLVGGFWYRSRFLD